MPDENYLEEFEKVKSLLSKDSKFDNALFDKLNNFFEKFDDMCKYDFERELTKIAEYKLFDKDSNFIIKKLEDLLFRDTNRKLSINARYSIFFLIFTYHKRMKNVKKMGELLKRFETQNISEDDKECAQLFFKHLWIMYKKFLGDKKSIKEAVEEAYELIKNKKISENAGILHNFAEAVVLAKELDLDIEEEYFSKAKKILENILQKWDYPMFYATYGRYLALEGKFEEARKNIYKAIDKEDPSKSDKDYALRINFYSNLLSEIRLRELLQKSTDKIDEMRRKLRIFEKSLSNKLAEERTKNIELLGLFATLISIALINAFSVISSAKPVMVITVSISLAGILLTVLSGFHILIYKKERLREHLIACFIGLLILTISIALLVLT